MFSMKPLNKEGRNMNMDKERRNMNKEGGTLIRSPPTYKNIQKCT